MPQVLIIPQVGEIIGLYLNGYISEKVGYKKTMIGSMVLMILFLFLPFFAPNIQTLLAGEILQGIPWGVFQTLSTTYASEVMPTCLRAYLTTYVNLCWVFGQLIGAGVLRGFLERTDQWAYRMLVISTLAFPRLTRIQSLCLAVDMACANLDRDDLCT